MSIEEEFEDNKGVITHCKWGRTNNTKTKRKTR
jgi:hypothetical protein